MLNKKEINAVFIATPHSAHAEQIVSSLKAGKNVFVEKPLAISEQELMTIIETKLNHNQLLTVGFNRRFAPLSLAINDEFKNISEPLVINIRVNAGLIPKDHWTQIPEIGAGRIIGEMCHFIDLMQYFTNAEPVKVYAECIASGNTKIKSDDNIAIVIRFSNGSIGNLSYVANGDKSMPKEFIEVFGAGKAASIDNFLAGSIYSGNKIKRLKSSGKGHKQEVDAFLTALIEGKDAPISFRSVCLTTITTFKIIDSLYTGLPQQIELDV